MSPMRRIGRGIVIAVVVLHGLIHLLGAAKGLGWAEVPELQEPVSTAMGVAWLAAAVVMVAVAGLMARRWRWWWVTGLVAALGSQVLIVTAWRDAWAGTLANLVLVAASVHGAASLGPWSLRAEYRRRVAAIGPAPSPAGPVTEADVARLPEPLATWVRRSGAVGQPRVTGFRARIHGRIRSGPDRPWMAFTGEQVNRFGADPVRLFFMDATMAGLPVDVLHVIAGGHATMRARVCSLKTMVDAAGAQMDRAEAVTLFNDVCLLAPAALVDAPVVWMPVDDHHVKGLFTWGGHTVLAELAFDANGDLIGFVSDDRLRAAPDGSSFTPMRWSTPVRAWATFGPWRVASVGEGRWHSPDGEFTYLEFHADDMTFVHGAPTGDTVTAGPAPTAVRSGERR